MSKLTYIVIHGSLKGVGGFGSPVEMSPEEAAELPCLVTKAEFEALQAEAHAHEVATAALEKSASSLKAITPKLKAALKAKKPAAVETKKPEAKK